MTELVDAGNYLAIFDPLSMICVPVTSSALRRCCTVLKPSTQLSICNNLFAIGILHTSPLKCFVRYSTYRLLSSLISCMISVSESVTGKTQFLPVNWAVL
jgi:hypothetical protein